MIKERKKQKKESRNKINSSQSADRSVEKNEMLNLYKDESYYNLLCDIKGERERKRGRERRKNKKE